MANTPKLNIRILEPGDTDNVANLNKALETLDVMSQLVLQSVTTQSQPATPQLGQAWYVPTSGVTGPEWSLNTGKIGFYVANGNGPAGWRFIDTFDGITAFVLDQGTTGNELSFVAGNWISATGQLSIDMVHPGAPNSSLFRFPLFRTASPATLQSVVITNTAPTAYPTGRSFPELYYASALDAASPTTVITPDLGATGYDAIAPQVVRTFGLAATNPSAVTLPADVWLFYDTQQTFDQVYTLSLHIKYTGGQ